MLRAWTGTAVEPDNGPTPFADLLVVQNRTAQFKKRTAATEGAAMAERKLHAAHQWYTARQDAAAAAAAAAAANAEDRAVQCLSGSSLSDCKKLFCAENSCTNTLRQRGYRTIRQ